MHAMHVERGGGGPLLPWMLLDFTNCGGYVHHMLGAFFLKATYEDPKDNPFIMKSVQSIAPSCKACQL